MSRLNVNDSALSVTWRYRLTIFCLHNHPWIWFLKLWVRTPFMARCTPYNIMWLSLSGTCNRSVVFSGYSGFLPRYNWNIVESSVKHHQTINHLNLIVCVFQITHDFLTWFRMFLIIMVSGAVTIHSVLYPNYPLIADGIKRALARAFFAMFLTKIDDLDGEYYLVILSLIK